MSNVRVRFMDLLYAASVGNSLQFIDASRFDGKFIVSILLIVVILEDFFLYYADVAPENADHHGLNFWGMTFEIMILTSWFFAFDAFVKGSWNFLIYLAAFSGLKTLGGFINCAATKSLMSFKFARELVFLLTVFTTLYVFVTRPVLPPDKSLMTLLPIAVGWTAQTFSWWVMTKLFRTIEGKTAILPET